MVGSGKYLYKGGRVIYYERGWEHEAGEVAKDQALPLRPLEFSPDLLIGILVLDPELRHS